MRLKNAFGLHIRYEAWDGVRQLPFFLQSTYEFQYALIEDAPCILIFPRETLAAMAVLKKHVLQIRKVGQLPVVFVLDQISEFRRKTFLENKIPFIVEEKMFYLPFIGTYLIRGLERDEKMTEKFMPSAQLAFFYYLYAQKKFLPVVELSESLPFSAMTVNRAVKQLLSTHLFQRHKDGVRVILQGVDQPQQLYAQAQKFLKSPVRLTGYMGREFLTQEFMLAGTSALAEYTRLNPELCPTYAVKYGAVCRNSLQRELVDEKKQVRVELWEYSPHILSRSSLIDPLSLAVSLRDNVDERVEQAVDELLKNVWESKDGKWV